MAATVKHNIHEDYELIDSDSVHDIVGVGFEDCFIGLDPNALTSTDPEMKLVRGSLGLTRIPGSY